MGTQTFAGSCTEPRPLQDLVPNPARENTCDPPRFISKWNDKNDPHRGWDWINVKDVPYGPKAGPLFLRALDVRTHWVEPFGEKNVMTIEQYKAGARIPSYKATEKEI